MIGLLGFHISNSNSAIAAQSIAFQFYWLVTPTYKPPTLQQLRDSAEDLVNFPTASAGNVDGQRIGIYFDGRIVGIRQASATKHMTLISPLLSEILGYSMSLCDADEIVQWKH